MTRMRARPMSCWIFNPCRRKKENPNPRRRRRRSARAEISSETNAVKHLLNLDLVHPHHTDGDGFTLEAATGHGLQGWVVDLDAFGHRPFVIAVGKLVLRWGAGQTLQKFDSVGLVLGMFGHRATRDVDVGAPRRLVREHNTDPLNDGFV